MAATSGASPTVDIDVERIRQSTLKGQAGYFTELCMQNPGQISSLTSRLVSLVASAELPPIVLSVWPTACQDTEAIVVLLRQTHSVIAQRWAMKFLVRKLRTEESFDEAWSVVGGAEGLAQIMSGMSVQNVDYFCNKLGSLVSAGRCRETRQRAFTELLKGLCDPPGAESPKSPQSAKYDPRPLQVSYAELVKACGGQTILEWTANSKSLESWSSLRLHDVDFFRRHYVDEVVAGRIEWDKFLSAIQPLIQDDAGYFLEMLDKFPNKQFLGMEAGNFLQQCFIPHIRAFSSQRRIKRDLNVRLWVCLVKHLEAQNELGQTAHPPARHHHELISLCVKSWKRCPLKFSDILTRVIALAPNPIIEQYSLSFVLAATHRGSRYKLLRLFLRHGSAYGFDIGPAEELDFELTPTPLKTYTWNENLFDQLSAQEAISLFEKFRKLGWKITSGRGNSVTSREAPDNVCGTDALIRAMLIRRAQKEKCSLPPEADEFMQDMLSVELPRRMKKATLSRKPDERASWALAALNLCVATGDLSSYAETLKWARRFNRDYEVVQKIYSSYESLLLPETIELLTSVPRKNELPTASSYLGDVEFSNEVLLEMFKTANMIASEPHFNRQLWSGGFFLLVRHVVKRRMELANAFQDRFSLTDSEMYDDLWSPTLEMLVSIESSMLDAPDRPFGGEKEGFLYLDNQATKDLRPHAMSFLDNLAKARDHIWRLHRIREKPAVATLPKPWPQGLPLYDLMRCKWERPAQLPYLQSRARDIVFFEASILIKEYEDDDQLEQAIGVNVDSWQYALTIYLLQSDDDGDDRLSRIKKVWSHVTGDLSRERMSSDEAFRFWKPLFEEAGVKEEELEFTTDYDKVKQRSAPSLPVYTSSYDPVEWHPTSEFNAQSTMSKVRKLKTTYLDILLELGARPSFRASGGVSFKDCGPKIPASSLPPSFWRPSQEIRKGLTGAQGDAYISAAILALNSKKGGDTGLLMKPFPDSGPPRFPGLYLHQDFLEAEADENQSDILELINSMNISLVPPQLLVMLAASIWKKVEKQGGSWTDTPRFLLSIVKLISRGHSPSMASPIIINFILENPDLSAWHRTILSKHHLSALPLPEVEAFLRKFSNAIVEMFEAQSEKGRLDDGEKNTKRIKITTIKMFAQLLQDSTFVSPMTTVQLLITLLGKSTHIDIRVPALEGLVKVAHDSSDRMVRLRVLDALRQYAVPIASSINEMFPNTDWQGAECRGELPELWSDQASGPPVLQILIRVSRYSKWLKDEAETLRDMVYAAVYASVENHQRWTALFLKKNGYVIPDGQQLPPVPLWFPMFERVIVYGARYIPQVLFENIRKYTVFMLNPPAWATEIKESIKQNEDLARSAEARHILGLWDHDKPLDAGFSYLCRSMQYTSAEVEPGYLTYQEFEDFFYEVTDLLLKQANPKNIDALVASIPLSKPDPDNTGKNVFTESYHRRVIGMIDAMRTPEWQADPNRTPSWLPDVFIFKANLLKLPGSLLRPHQAPTAESLEALALKVIQLLQEVADSGWPIINNLTRIKKQLRSLRSASCIAIAVRLGSTPAALDGSPSATLVEHLRVDVAADLFNHANVFSSSAGSSDAGASRAREVLGRWEASPIEVWRMTAMKMPRLDDSEEVRHKRLMLEQRDLTV